MRINKKLSYVVLIAAGLLHLGGLSAVDLKTMAQRKSFKQKVLTDIKNGNWKAAADGIQEFENANQARFAIDLRPVFAKAYTNPGSLPANWPSSLQTSSARKQAKKIVEQALNARNFAEALAGILKLQEATRREFYELFVTNAVNAEEQGSAAIPAPQEPSPDPIIVNVEELEAEQEEQGAAIPAPQKALNSKLRIAASNGDIEKADELLRMGADINANDEKNTGDTALIAASKNGHEGAVSFLLERDITTIDHQNNVGNTALMAASEAGHSPIVVRSLLLAGANTELKNADNKTALDLARENKHDAIIETLTSKSLPLEVEQAKLARQEALNSELRIAASNGDLERVNYLLTMGADINANDEKDTEDTALIAASKNGHEGVVRLLLEKDITTIDHQNECDRTALVEATEAGHIAIVQHLLLAGANTELKDISDRTALDLARYYQKDAIIAALGGKPLPLEDDDKEPQQEALNSKLRRAASNGDIEKADELLTMGADINANDEKNTGDTALIAASKNGHEGVVSLLLKKDIRTIDHQNNVGRTALMAASEANHIAIVQHLLLAGANTKLKDMNNKTALDLARENKHDAIIEALISKPLPLEDDDKEQPDTLENMPLKAFAKHIKVREPQGAQGLEEEIGLE